MQAHTRGLQVVANPTMKKQANTIMTVPVVLAVEEPSVAPLNKNWPTDAKAMKQMNRQSAAI